VKIPEIAYKQKAKIEIPHKLMTNTELTPSEKFTFLSLLFFFKSDYTTRVPNKYLAELTNTTYGLIAVNLKKIEEKDFITKEGIGADRIIILTKKGKNLIGRKHTKDD